MGAGRTYRATPFCANSRVTRAVVETLENRVLLAGDGLQATYYSGPNFTGSSSTRVDSSINFNWKHTTPVKDVAANQVSVKWTGTIAPPTTGKYTFYITSQGWVRFSLNGQILVNAWHNHHNQTNAKTVTLTGGTQYTMELDFQGGKAPPIISLGWKLNAPKQKRIIIPTSQLYSGTALAPSNLTATQVSGTQVNLAWVDNSDNETSFQVQRSIDGVNFNVIATLPANTTAFSDTALPPGRHAVYDVVAADPSGISPPSVPAAVSPPAPAQPVALDAGGVAGNEIDLSWQDPTGYSAAYQIERSTDGGQTFSPLAVVNAPATTYADATLTPSTTYTYRVTAVNDTAASQATYPIIANSLSGFATTNHPAPTTLGSSTHWQYSTPTDQVFPDSERPGNIFYLGDTIAFVLDPMRGQTGSAKTYEVRDYYGNLVDSGTVPDPLDLTLKPEPLGWYKLYLFGDPALTTATFGDVVATATFCVFRTNSNFPDSTGMRAAGYDYSPVFTRVDPTLNFTSTGAWSSGTPDATKIPAGPFAARWTGQLRPTQTASYLLSVSSYSRLWLNGRVVIDAWNAVNPTTYTVTLQAGNSYAIRIDYYRTTLTPVFVFDWKDSTQTYAPYLPVPQSVLYSSSQVTGSGDGLSATYYGLLLAPDPSGSNDQVVRDITGMGPQRYAADASNPSATIAALGPQIAYDSQNYTPLDPTRNRQLLIAFPNGTEPYLSGVTQIVQQFQNQVEYWEPQNEPNYAYTNGADFVPIMRDFYNTVKAVNPNLKVIGPGPVDIGPIGLKWLTQFFAAGGGQYIDAFSFHAYNNVNRDLTLARESLNGLKNLLNQYGLGNIPIWQTEQGYMAAVYGAYEPENQGEWTMLEEMVFEQYGIPKEQNVLWYDKSHGFWDEPMFWENQYGGLNPAAPLMRVWSEELYGTNFSQAYDFGADGNNTYIGSLFSGPGKNVAVFMTGGATDGQVNLNVTSGASLTVVDAFGNTTTVAVINGRATINVPILPVYVELASGQSISVIPVNWGPDLATQPGVVALSSYVGPTIANDSVDKIHDGILQNWYYNQGPNDHSWTDTTPAGTQDWVELDLPAAQTIDHVVVRAPTPWQYDGAPLDYELQYYSNGQWITIQHVQEEAKTFGAYSPSTDTTVDSYYSERSIFNHTFSPVVTSKIRLLVRDKTWGGGATQQVVQAGGQTGQYWLTLQEIEIYGQ